MSFCQYSATAWLWLVSIETSQESPFTVHQTALFCQVRAENMSASSGDSVPSTTDGSFWWTFTASAAYCAHVVGTVMPYFLKRSAR